MNSPPAMPDEMKIEPATDEKIKEWKETAELPGLLDRQTLRLIARIEQDRERIKELEKANETALIRGMLED